LDIGLALILTLILSGCSDKGTEPVGRDEGGGEAVSFALDLQPVFDAACVSCHGVGGNGGLDLRPGLAWGNLVGVPSVGYAQQLVVAGDPELSLLFLKISGAAGVGSRMPVGGALDAAKIDAFRRWILDGAPNN
jgi:mono/diheme cytochrome c family protein